MVSSLFATLVVAGSFFGPALGRAHPAEVDLAPRAACATGIHMFVAPGHGATSGTPGRLQSLINKVKSSIPGTNVITIAYDPNASEDQQMEAGRQQVISNLQAYVARCPHTPIMLLGYSEGGMIMMNVLCGSSMTNSAPLSSKYASNIISTILYGEETYRAYQSYDAGTCRNNAPYTPRQNTQACAPFAPHIQSYCDSDDPYCCSGGNDSASHLEYPQRYDSTALDYVVSHYNAYRKGQ